MGANFDLPDGETVAWVQSVVGPCDFVDRFEHSHGASQLWRLRGSAEFFWLKLHKSLGKMAGEAHALTSWTPGIGRSPALIAIRLGPASMLTEEMPGMMATEVALNDEEERRLWGQAGAYLVELQRIQNDWFGATNLDGTPQGAPTHDPVGFVRRNIETRLRQGVDRELWNPSERKFLESAMERWTQVLVDEIPTAVHRDFGPRNWLTKGAGNLDAVIDWEHARWDIRAADLCRMWDDACLHKPWLIDEFFAGYGGLSEPLRWKINALRLMQAVGGIVWSQEVGATDYGALNREALHRLMGFGDP